MKKSVKIFFPVTVIFLLVLFVSTAFAAGEKVTLKAENRTEGVYLEWNGVDGAYYYEVYRQTGKKGEKLLLSKVQSTAYEDSEAKEGAEYTYTVIPTFSDYSVGQASDDVTVYRLSAAYISSAGSQKNGLFVKWKAVKNAKGYRVYRKSAEDGEWAVVSKLGAKATGFLDESISPGQKYAYCVRAFVGEYEGSAGNEKELSYMSYPPAKSVSITEKGLKLDWEAADEAVYYVVFRKSGDTGYKPCALLDATYTEYEDKSVKAGQHYSYYICGADEKGNFGSFDKELSARYVKKSEMTAAVNTPDGIKLYWSRSEGCQGYGIFRKSGKEKEWKLRGVVYGESKLSAVDKKVSDKEIYTYTVRAFKDKALAAYEDEGISMRFYAAPEKLSGKGSVKDGVTLNWSKAKTDADYAVYRKVADGEWQFMCFVKDSSFTDKDVKAKTKYTYAVEVYEGSILRSGRAEVSVAVK